MITRSNKPHFVRSARDKNTRAGNSTLLCLMLNRITKKNMNNYFKIIVDYGLGVEKVFNRFVKLLNKNIKQQRNICWKQLQQEVMKKKNNQKILKSAVNFSIRYKKVVLNKAFHKIIFFVGFKEKKLSKKFFTSRQWIMNNIFTRLLETKIKESFIKLLKSAREKDLYKGKVQIFMSKVEKIKQKVIMKTWNCLKKNDKEEFEQLKGKLRSIENQLLVKEKKCKELQNVLEKDDIYENRRRAISQTNIKEERNKRSNSEEKKSENGNGNSHKQYSIIGSVLNGSFLTFKSGISSGQNSMNGIDCNCGYKHKYSYYKCESVSLKNQLEIIKKQLQVTKDLNEHLQNQFTDYLGEEQNSLQMEKLRREVKELKKEREFLRQKIMKYQKYISNLKYEFKFKMQNLYRNIKKGQ